VATSAFFKYNSFIDELSKGGHNLTTAVYKVALTNTAPTAANGYPAGGLTITTTTATTSGGIFKLVLADTAPPFTATAGGIGPFRYAILYNSSASNKLVGYYDYGAGGLTLAAAETLTMDFDGTNGVFTLQ
jgi:hypothetical protein